MTPTVDYLEVLQVAEAARETMHQPSNWHPGHFHSMLDSYIQRIPSDWGCTCRNGVEAAQTGLPGLIHALSLDLELQSRHTDRVQTLSALLRLTLILMAAERLHSIDKALIAS